MFTPPLVSSIQTRPSNKCPLNVYVDNIASNGKRIYAAGGAFNVAVCDVA